MSRYLLCGKNRAAAKRTIQQCLDDAGINMKGIACLAQVTPQAVSSTINGHIHSPKVLRVLREIGVPERYLFDPHNQQTAMQH